MPAECLIGTPCGVQAVGMCLRCRRPFCMTHQGRRQYDYTPFSDLCSVCAPEMQSEDHRNSPAFLRDEGLGLFSSGTARQMLLDAGVPTVQLCTSEVTWQKTGRFSRQTEPVVNLVPRETGWLLGELKWEWSEGSGRMTVYRDGPRQTALLNKSTVEDPYQAESEYGLVLVTAQHGGYTMHYEKIGTDFKGSWAQATEAIRRLAGS